MTRKVDLSARPSQIDLTIMSNKIIAAYWAWEDVGMPLVRPDAGAAKGREDDH